jgi:hypothetical protein
VYVLIRKRPADQLSATVNLNARSLPKTRDMIAHTVTEPVCSDKRSLSNCWCGVMYSQETNLYMFFAVESGLQCTFLSSNIEERRIVRDYAPYTPSRCRSFQE